MKKLSIFGSLLAIVTLLCVSVFGQQTITTTTVTDNGGNVTIETTAITATEERAVLKTQTYSGSSTLLKTQLFCYNGTAEANCPTQTVTFPVLSKSVYTTQGNVTSESVYTYNQYGEILTDTEYDFGATTPSFTTTNTYGSCGQGATVNNAPCSVVVLDNVGTIVSSINYTYNAAGEPVAITNWNGSAFLSSSATYNSNGTAATVTSMDGVSSTFTYTGSGGCPFGASMFPTSSTTGGITTSATYSCSGGNPLTVTDANGGTFTSVFSDPFNRLTAVTNPLGYTSTEAYTPTTVESVFTFGSSTHDSIATVDSLNRPSTVNVRWAPSSPNFDKETTAYSWAAGYPVVSVTAPSLGVVTVSKDPLDRVISTTDAGGGTLSNVYTNNTVLETLGPAPTAEAVKQSQIQVDAFNRQVSVSNSSITTQTFPTGLTMVQTRGSQTRTTVVDPLGRTVSTTTPEAGTTTYAYDSVATPACGTGWSSSSLTTEPGALIQISYANGNTTCFAARDSNGRLTDVKYIGATTYCSRFRYDNSTGATGTLPSGIAPTNSLGRLVEGETDTCSAYPPTSATMLTDRWFSYDLAGNTTQMWESTPNSVGSVDGKYYYSTATYFPDNSIQSVTLSGTPGYTATWTEDGEGRPYSLNVGGTKIVDAVSYNGVSSPTSMAFGLGRDIDSYIYDPNTGRMTAWTFSVGAAPNVQKQSGSMTWNQNGTLRTLAITDGFNAGGTQTCTYGTAVQPGYDSIGRMLTDDCGAKWSQAFSYDIYDNLTKAGTNGADSWPPSGTAYSSTSNRYTGNSAITYDASGNLLTDTLHTYTWSGNGSIHSIDSTVIIQDAFGSTVEVQGAANTEIWYTPAGKTAFMKGGTYEYAYWSAPGGTVTNVAGNTNYYQHKDWIGNTRVVSSISNSTVYADQAVAPYGEIYDQFGTSATNVQNFSGHTQDVVAGTYDAPARELNSIQGRWLSPDPSGSGWNLYAYSSNPMSNSDPTGLQNDPSGSAGDACTTCNFDQAEADYSPSPVPPSDGGDGIFFSNNDPNENATGSGASGSPVVDPLAGTITPTVYGQVGTGVHAIPLYGCIRGCSTPSNAGETAEMRAKRYQTNFMSGILFVAGFFNGGMFEAGEAVGGVGLAAPTAGQFSGSENYMLGSASAEAAADPYFNVVGKQITFEYQAEQPLLSNSARPMGWESHVRSINAMNPGGSVVKGGYSVYQEALDGSGFWRTSDHWGALGRSEYSLNVDFASIPGGVQVPGEANLWLYNHPVTGFVRYTLVP